MRGTNKVEAHDPDVIWKHSTAFLKGLVHDLYDFGQTMKIYGTAGFLTDSAECGDSPVNNWLGVGDNDFQATKAHRINAFEITVYEII
ncbi:MAG: hypothetical protein OEM02_07295 [Desulfobulbaceae bacterium]|nr:hypothetical protein [Desulfobulbaceae bacterium]